VLLRVGLRYEECGNTEEHRSCEAGSHSLPESLDHVPSLAIPGLINTIGGYSFSGMRGYSGDKDSHLRRLRRIEGQVRGLQRMVDEDAYCIDVLTQVAAVTKALESMAISLLDEHVRHCVRDAASGDELDAKVTEVTRAVERLLRS
jgi:CsoR family transcriptional regulator, copper-sensing transcriptional repressor